MLELHPHLEIERRCPRCREPLAARGWYMPGMRVLANLHCATCNRSFYGDLSVGGSINYEMLLDAESGEIFGGEDADWLKDWLIRGFSARTVAVPPLKIEKIRSVQRPLLLNCLDVLYGHSLLKLLNAQHHLDHAPDFDLVVIVPRCLRWLVPDGVAEIWTVDVPLSKGWVWSDGLAADLHRRFENTPALHVSRALSHPAPDDVTIERFTGVAPFPIEQWSSRMVQPTITYIWRDDRCWGAPRDPAGQAARVGELAAAMQSEWPSVDFAVTGLSAATGLPSHVIDLRTDSSDEATERALCRRYAASHLVMGIHGSNMLLPSAHAGATIDLMPPDRWGNVTQDIIYRPTEAREASYRYRYIPASVTPPELAQIATALLRRHSEHARICWNEGCRHHESALAAL